MYTTLKMLSFVGDFHEALVWKVSRIQ